MRIRPATEFDAEAIAAIYELRPNRAHSPAVTQPKQFRRAIQALDGPFGFWVAEENNLILGWQSLLPMRPSPALRQVFAEPSTYIAPESRGTGLGKRLLSHAHTHAEKTELEYLMAFVASTDRAALGLALRLGYTRVGELPQSLKNLGRPTAVVLVYQVKPIQTMQTRDQF